jgi:hypothetical protein
MDRSEEAASLRIRPSEVRGAESGNKRLMVMVSRQVIAFEGRQTENQRFLRIPVFLLVHTQRVQQRSLRLLGRFLMVRWQAKKQWQKVETAEGSPRFEK